MNDDAKKERRRNNETFRYTDNIFLKNRRNDLRGNEVPWQISVMLL